MSRTVAGGHGLGASSREPLPKLWRFQGRAARSGELVERLAQRVVPATRGSLEHVGAPHPLQRTPQAARATGPRAALPTGGAHRRPAAALPRASSPPADRTTPAPVPHRPGGGAVLSGADRPRRWAHRASLHLPHGRRPPHSCPDRLAGLTRVPSGERCCLFARATPLMHPEA